MYAYASRRRQVCVPACIWRSKGNFQGSVLSSHHAQACSPCSCYCAVYSKRTWHLHPCFGACTHPCVPAPCMCVCTRACLGFLLVFPCLPPTWHRSAGMEEACCVTWVLGLVLGPSSLSDKHYLSPPPPSSHAIPLAQIELISLTMAAALSAPLKPTLFPCQAAYHS